MGFPFKTRATSEFVTLTTKNGDSFEIESKKDITVLEDSKYQQLLQEHNVKDETRLLLDLAALISREKGVTADRALKVIIPSQEVTTDEEKELEKENDKIRGEYTGKIVELNTEIILASASKALFGAYTIYPRLLGPIEARIKEIKTKSAGRDYTDEEKVEASILEQQIDDINSWTLEDIKQLPKQVVEVLAKFFNTESAGQQEVAVDEESGKSSSPRKNKSSSTKDKSLPTGEKSTGESNGTGPMTDDLVMVSSGISQEG